MTRAKHVPKRDEDGEAGMARVLARSAEDAADKVGRVVAKRVRAWNKALEKEQV